MSQFELVKESVFRGEHNTSYDSVFHLSNYNKKLLTLTVEQLFDLAYLITKEANILKQKQKHKLQSDLEAAEKAVEYYKEEIRKLEQL